MDDYADKSWLAHVGEDALEKWFSAASRLALRVIAVFIFLQMLRHLDDIIPIVLNNSPLGS
ncbi:MAG: hypothetical protein NUV90_00950 [Candidatus Parcubacteria bacterium]|nr:hypothetical protein [Candidatus Parcubacteria bacterium]